MPRSPLHPYHQEIGARFVDFGGWEMPIRYTSVLAEHRAVRESTGWFDVSHLGRFSWSGEGAGPALSRLLCNDHERIGPGRAQYTLMLNPRGGVIDDLIIWKLGSGEVMVMPNGVNHLRVMDGFRAAAPDARLLDLRPGTAALAVQGPDSPARVKGLLGEVPGHFGVIRVDYGGREVWVAGTGYTGERGVELVTDPQTAEELARRLSRGGALPCGLGARDLLRLEAGFPLWGHDLDEGTTPLEAGLEWAVRFGRDFVGRPALERARRDGPERTRVSFRMADRRIPREGFALRAGDSRGTVTSGNFSPVLGVGIGMGYLSRPRDPGAAVEVEIRGRWVVTEPVRGGLPPTGLTGAGSLSDRTEAWVSDGLPSRALERFLDSGGWGSWRRMPLVGGVTVWDRPPPGPVRVAVACPNRLGVFEPLPPDGCRERAWWWSDPLEADRSPYRSAPRVDAVPAPAPLPADRSPAQAAHRSRRAAAYLARRILQIRGVRIPPVAHGRRFPVLLPVAPAPLLDGAAEELVIPRPVHGWPGLVVCEVAWWQSAARLDALVETVIRAVGGERPPALEDAERRWSSPVP